MGGGDDQHDQEELHGQGACASRFFARLAAVCLSFVAVTEFVTILAARGDKGLVRTCGHLARCCAGLGGAKQVC